MEQVKVTVEPNAQGELTIRTGTAMPPEPKKSVSLSGTIDSVLDFDNKRRKDFNIQKAHVLIDRKNLAVTLTYDENEARTYTIEGCMILHEFIGLLGINTDRHFSIQEVINLLKLNRRFFKSRPDHTNMLAALQTFTAKTEIEFTQSNDYKGSVANSKLTKIRHDVPLSFEMFIPPFEGMEKKNFIVDIEVYPDSGTLKMAFVSVALAEIIEEETENVFKRVKEQMAEIAIIQC